MKKILFLIHDLGRGGAEKVLVNLVNNMDPQQFDITVMTLFGGGVNEKFLSGRVSRKSVFPWMLPGNTKIMKLFSPRILHQFCIRERYDIEVSYLEGPSARVISGCQDPNTKKVCWIHSVQGSAKRIAVSFRSVQEARNCYNSFDRLICVSKSVKDAFLRDMAPVVPAEVFYNTVESEKILQLSLEDVDEGLFRTEEHKLIAVGTLKPLKAFDRLIRITARLREEGLPVKLYLLGEGPERENLKALTRQLELDDAVSFLGYQNNPYRYIRRSDLFVCSSTTEGFSTATTEALIVGTPVCTTNVSGMQEMLGDSEFGLITENSEEALFRGVRRLLREPSLLSHYRKKAALRGQAFGTQRTVNAVEDMLNSLMRV